VLVKFIATRHEDKLARLLQANLSAVPVFNAGMINFLSQPIPAAPNRINPSSTKVEAIFKLSSPCFCAPQKHIALHNVFG
jgi:hypothetical protein